MMDKVKIVNVVNDIFIGNNDEVFTLIAGPCAIENEEMTLMMAGELKKICEKLNVKLIFKSSFDKANRSSILSLIHI